MIIESEWDEHGTEDDVGCEDEGREAVGKHKEGDITDTELKREGVRCSPAVFVGHRNKKKESNTR